MENIEIKKEAKLNLKEGIQMADKTKTKDVWDDAVLKGVLKDIEKTFGKGAIMKMGENGSFTSVPAIPSGSLIIDHAIGINGYPKGRITEIYGPESSGKTTLALHAIASAQKDGGVGAFIDAEHALDPKYAENIGVDVSNLLVSQPDSGEQALDILEMLVKSNAVDIVVLDSVAALVPKAELEGEMSDQSIGLQARLMSKALRKLNGIVSKTNTTVIFINQIREKVGVMFGNPEVTSGGRALRFYSSLRIETRKGETIVKNGEATGNKIKVKVVKNKVAPPFKTGIITINYNEGIDKLNEIIELGTLYEILEKSGVWYSYKNEKIGQGKEAVKQWLIDNPEKQDEIAKAINEKLPQ